MKSIAENQLEGEQDSENLLSLNLFWLGFMIYIVSYSYSSTDRMSQILLNVLQILGLLLLFPSAVSLIHLKIENGYLRIIFILYIFWSATVILRGIKFDYDSMKQMLFNPRVGALGYLVPMVLLFPRKLSYYRKIFQVIFLLGIFFLIFSLLSIKDLLVPYNNILSQGIIERFSQQLSLPAGLLIFTFIYHSKSRNLFSLFVLILTFLLAVLRARRGLILISFSILFFSFLIYQYANKARVINIVLSVFLVLMVAYATVKVYERNRKDTFGLITERISQNTRTEVEQYFVKDFKTKDWIIGRGMNGLYFCPGVNDGETISVYRRVIETGYLQIILNGGLISLGLLLLILIPAIFKSLFHSKNLLSKAAGVWLILFLIYTYPGAPSIFTLNYILVWISVGISYSSEIRSLNDREVLKKLNPDLCI